MPIKKYYIIIALLMTVTSFAAGVDKYPVQWTSNLKLKSIAAIPQLFANPSYPGSQVNYVGGANDAQMTVATTCNDYFKLTKKDYEPANNMEIAAESFFKLNCDPLLFLQHAKPAKQSFLRQFNLQKDFGLLPAKYVFPNLGDGAQPIGDVKTAFPDTTTSDASANHINLTSKAAGMTSDIRILGWGDFNGKGNDQMLIFVGNYTLQGTFHSYTVYVLSRDSNNAPLQ